MKKLLVVTSYPPQKSRDDKKVVGGAFFTKKTLHSLVRSTTEELQITVLAEKLEESDKSPYHDQTILVKRLWERNSFQTFFTLFYEIIHYDKNAPVLVQFEIAMFGNAIHLGFFLLFLLALKIFQRKTIVVFHQVIPTVSSSGNQLNLFKSKFFLSLYAVLLPLFYKTLLRMISKGIATDTMLTKKLKELYSSVPIATIPLVIEPRQKKLTQQESRKKLGLSPETFIILSFGFLAPYKGSDWLSHAYYTITRKNSSWKDVQLLFAGGPNPNHTNNQSYTAYIKKIEAECGESHATITGFVSDELKEAYYQAADVVVFPYRTHMSASGPLAETFACERPFLLSSALSTTLDTDDIQQTMKTLGITKQDMLFTLEEESFTNKITDIRKNKQLREKLVELGKAVAVLRNPQAIGKRYYEEIF